MGAQIPGTIPNNQLMAWEHHTNTLKDVTRLNKRAKDNAINKNNRNDRFVEPKLFTLCGVNFCKHWDLIDAIRDLFQNAIDSMLEVHHREKSHKNCCCWISIQKPFKDWTEEDANHPFFVSPEAQHSSVLAPASGYLCWKASKENDGPILTVINKKADFGPEALTIGCTTKSRQGAGGHGEGLKAIIATAIRNALEVEIYQSKIAINFEQHTSRIHYYCWELRKEKIPSQKTLQFGKLTKEYIKTLEVSPEKDIIVHLGVPSQQSSSVPLENNESHRVRVRSSSYDKGVLNFDVLKKAAKMFLSLTHRRVNSLNSKDVESVYPFKAVKVYPCHYYNSDPEGSYVKDSLGQYVELEYPLEYYRLESTDPLTGERFYRLSNSRKLGKGNTYVKDPLGRYFAYPIKYYCRERTDPITGEVLYRPSSSGRFWHGNTYVKDSMGNYFDYPLLDSSGESGKGWGLDHLGWHFVSTSNFNMRNPTQVMDVKRYKRVSRALLDGKSLSKKTYVEGILFKSDLNNQTKWGFNLAKKDAKSRDRLVLYKHDYDLAVGKIITSLLNDGRYPEGFDEYFLNELLEHGMTNPDKIDYLMRLGEKANETVRNKFKILLEAKFRQENVKVKYYIEYDSSNESRENAFVPRWCDSRVCKVVHSILYHLITDQSLPEKVRAECTQNLKDAPSASGETEKLKKFIWKHRKNFSFSYDLIKKFISQIEVRQHPKPRTKDQKYQSLCMPQFVIDVENDQSKLIFSERGRKLKKINRIDFFKTIQEALKELSNHYENHSKSENKKPNTFNPTEMRGVNEPQEGTKEDSPEEEISEVTPPLDKKGLSEISVTRKKRKILNPAEKEPSKKSRGMKQYSNDSVELTPSDLEIPLKSTQSVFDFAGAEAFINADFTYVDDEEAILELRELLQEGEHIKIDGLVIPSTQQSKRDWLQAIEKDAKLETCAQRVIQICRRGVEILLGSHKNLDFYMANDSRVDGYARENDRICLNLGPILDHGLSSPLQDEELIAYYYPLIAHEYAHFVKSDDQHKPAHARRAEISMQKLLYGQLKAKEPCQLSVPSQVSQNQQALPPASQFVQGILPLRNGGADCFMNSVLQVIMSDDLLLNALRKTYSDDTTHKATELLSILDQYQAGNGHLSTQGLRSWLPKATLSSHEDAMEFLSALSQNITLEKYPDLYHKNLITYHWTLQDPERHPGHPVNHSTHQLQRMFERPIELPDAGDILDGQKLVRDSFELQPGDRGHTLKYLDADYFGVSQSSLIADKPKRLVIQLKRFTPQLTKIETLVRMPEILQVNQSKLQLGAFIVHTGNLEGGHYYSLIRKNEGWFRVNDSMITAMPSVETELNRGYIYFYYEK